MVVLTGELEVSYDVRRAQRKWTRTSTLELSAYMGLSNNRVMHFVLWSRVSYRR